VETVSEAPAVTGTEKLWLDVPAGEQHQFMPTGPVRASHVTLSMDLWDQMQARIERLDRLEAGRIDPLQFAFWLQGFAELNPGILAPTPGQWTMIVEHLAKVFTKVTPPMGNDGIQLRPYQIPETPGDHGYIGSVTC